MNIILPKQPELGLAGWHTFKVYQPETIIDQFLIDELGKWYDEGKGARFVDKVAHLLTNVFTRKNLTTTAGREWIAKILCNTSNQTNNYITHFAIGNDNTAANVADTALGGEQFRKAVSSSAEDSNTANISTFIAASEANFAWEEWGHFVDGTATVNSGVLFSHYIDSAINKSAPSTVTVDSVYTIADA